MNREDMRLVLERSLPVAEPIVAVLVPERQLKALVVDALNVTGSVNNEIPAEDMLELDRCAQALVNVDLVIEAEAKVRQAREVVRNWLDAGCMTIAPAHDIRMLVESLEGVARPCRN